MASKLSQHTVDIGKIWTTLLRHTVLRQLRGHNCSKKGFLLSRDFVEHTISGNHAVLSVQEVLTQFIQ